MRSITSMFGVLGTILATGLTVTTSYASTIHQGTLELGDAIFFYDGSLYDNFPIQAKAGQTVKLELRSYEFDPFLAIVGPQGEWLAHNNDANTDDINSALSFTFPQDGTYYIFVNTYSVTGQGNYVLELSRLVTDPSASEEEKEEIFFLTDSPPMPTPVFIQPTNWPNVDEDGEEVGDRPQVSDYQANNLGAPYADIYETTILD
ncbi:MAG: hypothetical protein F6K30_18305 [Cyanothece sp. SIO2G6]|nr:hypothetical protein [Cyanothece sp. SIO2G6]